ncbi:LysR family transcriptional regulator substrate-binding protein [Lactobacillus paragasseri]|uniref:LysR family transcriptional regulator substrate-binding protein n=1 Tax=Lactobacillus TaxID=1578 RepID=UPI0009B63468|nr:MULTISPECIES: LysR family transcriptional regulator substrate-binding protein [Lactobacillus]MDE3334383.1 LysR family transcriptional regulator substrate-binding protein [Lactobacillus paragasseri]MDE3382928.1 LysR family transcriptional regulator substrate-binding protein [Lactobacillus paragasseri]MDE3398043.1 LysR family transcriptional regulator substrate-binding protein [Lactobacillus paragasseri]MDK7120027.1 LysR family transcriptional regulator substrate-binding protein [Lactobacillus
MEEFTVDHESFCACLNYEHPLATKKSLKLADLKNENFVFYSGEEKLYHTVFDLCRESGFEPQFSFASHNIKSILNLVKNNEGISILMHAPEKAKDVTYVPIKPAFSTRLVCVRQPNQATKIASDFWNYLVK